MKKIAIVGVGALGEFVRASIEVAEAAQDSKNEIIVIGADVGLEMDPDEMKRKLMAVSSANKKLTIGQEEMLPLLAQERLYYDAPVSLITNNKPFYYGVPKSKKKGRKRWRR